MTQRNLLGTLAFGLQMLLIGNVSAQEPGVEQLTNVPERGEINWNGWIFRYWIDNGNEEGLVIENVQYKGRGVLRKASMPVVRVKYKGDASAVGSGCGPFADKFFNLSLKGIFSPALSHHTIRPFPGKNGASDVVAYQRVAADGTEILGIFVYAEIGGYRLWHGWNFTNHGRIEPTLFSSGWSCPDGSVKNDHKHHPYWRLEFSINGARNDIWELRSRGGQKPIARKLTDEQDLRRGVDEEVAIIVGAPNIAQHAIVLYPKDVNHNSDPPGRPWFEFARIDAAVRVYKPDEDRGWEFGARGELGYMDIPEPLENKENVLWISSHLEHVYVIGKDDENHNNWHWTGPVIELINW
jgi:hypothetical protein